MDESTNQQYLGAYERIDSSSDGREEQEGERGHYRGDTLECEEKCYFLSSLLKRYVPSK